MKYSRKELKSYTDKELQQVYSDNHESYIGHIWFAAILVFLLCVAGEMFYMTHSPMYIGEICALIGYSNAFRLYLRERRIKKEINRRERMAGRQIERESVLSLKPILCHHDWEPLTGSFNVYESGELQYPSGWLHCTKCGTTRKFKKHNPLQK